MNETHRPVTILIADDDEDDCILAQEALAENGMSGALRFVRDGEALMDYLRQVGHYAPPADAPPPELILLDLNMPRKDGREALREIKSDPHLRRIPVIILTTSRAEEDIYRSYDLGANSYIIKPITFDGLVRAMKALADYWLETAQLPPAAVLGPHG